MSQKINGDLEKIARYTGMDLMRLEGFVACADICGYKFIRPESTIIAAAPDLLEALKNLVDLLERIGDCRKDAEYIEAAKAAIAKAEGK